MATEQSSEVLRQNEKWKRFYAPSIVKRFQPNQSNCALPIIVVSELYKGVYCSQKVEVNLTALKAFLLPFPYTNLDLKVAEEFGQIQAELRKIGRPIGVMDALIAAIARANSATLITNNTKDFKHMSGLKLEDWLT